MFGADALRKLLEDYAFETVLDIGAGQGEHSRVFEAAGKRVTSVDYGKSIYFAEARPGVRFLVGDFNRMQFAQQFDCVWASHVLEHQLNAHAFLAKINAVTRDGGVVAVTVPPAKHEIVGGHVSLWNGGLLLYHLVLAGFDCSEARLKQYGYNISVIVRKRAIELPDDLAFDCGDIRRLRPFLPAALPFQSNHLDDPFDGDLAAVNW